MTEDLARFAERYAVSGEAAGLAAEYEALGTDYQANGYTTRDQADELGGTLGLERGHLLLDLGSGCGWPGLYLAARHGCSVISIDPVTDGCRVTRNRAVVDGIDRRSAAIRASADAIPLRAMTVDVVVHGDLLC